MTDATGTSVVAQYRAKRDLSIGEATSIERAMLRAAAELEHEWDRPKSASITYGTNPERTR